MAQEKLKVYINGREYEVERGTPLGEIFKIAKVKKALGGKLNGKILDLQSPVRESGEIVPITRRDPESLEILRHSLAHIMAQALKEIYGEKKVHLGVGPTTEEGFYYDVEVEDHRITEEELPQIEKKMREIIKRDYPILREELSRQEAVRLFEELKEKYKIDLIDRIPPEEPISVYKQGDFVDLCRGPHLPSTGRAGAFKLTSVAGAYWMGDSSKPQLQRIYGMAFWEDRELQERLKFYEEVKKRDHRRLGRELDFFTIDEDVGAGLILWLPKGATYRKILEDYLRQEHQRRGYQFVYTPHVGKSKLWETSGHLEFYRENMYPPMEMDNETYYVKPMNCPFHIAVYKSKVRSYRDLPMRLFELGTVYRYELSGVLHGLLRVRGFTQDDAHIICTEEQVGQEIKGALSFAMEVLRDFGFEEFKVFVSTRPEKSVGSDRQWEITTNALMDSVRELGLEYEIDEGGGAFYGPKIDMKVRDALGRYWQLSTIQFDFNLPERFNMTYVGEDNQRHRPYMVHRAMLGSIERFTGILLEHHAGLLPLWLSPVQVVIIPIADRHVDFGSKVRDTLSLAGIRVELDAREERMNAKIRDAELKKIPYLLIVGDREVESDSVSVRGKREGNVGSMKIGELLDFLRGKIEAKE